MIHLGVQYLGAKVNGAPSYISLHNTTLDICVPGYKGGEKREIAYSDIKYVLAYGDTLTMKIMRTEVTITGMNPRECADLAKVIEMGKNGPLENSKEFEDYQGKARKEEKRNERNEEKKRQEALFDRAENEIDGLTVYTSDNEDEISLKMSKLNKLYQKYQEHREDEYKQLSERVLQTYEDNVGILEDKFPTLGITRRALTQLDELKRKKEEAKKSEQKMIILVIIGLVILSILLLISGR